MANDWVAGWDFVRGGANGDGAIANCGLSIRRTSSAVREVVTLGRRFHRRLTYVEPLELPIARSWAVPRGGLGAAFFSG